MSMRGSVVGVVRVMVVGIDGARSSNCLYECKFVSVRLPFAGLLQLRYARRRLAQLLWQTLSYVSFESSACHPPKCLTKASLAGRFIRNSLSLFHLP